MLIDPSHCAKKILDIHGAAGAAWLEDLPRLVAGCARRWQLDILPPFDFDSYNYVCPAVRADGAAVVLKLAPPNPEVAWQAEALRICHGDGMVLLLEADVEQGILLMERLLPGTMLAELEDDEQVTEIAARMMRRVWRPAPPIHDFPTVARWAGGFQRLRDRFGGGCGPLPPESIERAEGLFKDLLASPEPPRLIHGDANPFNILKAEREPWLVIDPKGVVGHPLWDTATFLNNLPEGAPPHELRRVLARRVDQLAGLLDYPPQEVAAWGEAQCILSAFWTFEDHGSGWEPTLETAGLYREI